MMTYHQLKRLIDIIIATIGTIIFFPIGIAIAIAIKKESPNGPIFVESSDRVGKDGNIFRLFKFRSMIPNARWLQFHDPKYKKYLQEFKKNSYKLENDPFRTKIGKIIVKYSLDEIPQFLNVLRGEMSIVGPRPYYPDELEEQAKKFPKAKPLIAKAVSVKPGITGQWQVNGRSNINFDKRIELDSHYAENLNFWYDLNILIRTPYVMLSGQGSGVK